MWFRMNILLWLCTQSSYVFLSTSSPNANDDGVASQPNSVVWRWHKKWIKLKRVRRLPTFNETQFSLEKSRCSHLFFFFHSLARRRRVLALCRSWRQRKKMSRFNKTEHQTFFRSSCRRLFSFALSVRCDVHFNAVVTMQTRWFPWNEITFSRGKSLRNISRPSAQSFAIHFTTTIHQKSAFSPTKTIWHNERVHEERTREKINGSPNFSHFLFFFSQLDDILCRPIERFKIRA